MNNSKVNNFDVLKRMADENLKVQLCTMITDMNYSAKQGGTKVSVGVPGNVCFDINNGKQNAVLLLWDVEQFNATKAKMEAEDTCANCGKSYSGHLHWDGNKCVAGSVNGWFPKILADKLAPRASGPEDGKPHD